MNNNMTQEQQLRLAAFTQAAPLAMLRRQQVGMVAKTEDIVEVAGEIYNYLVGE